MDANTGLGFGHFISNADGVAKTILILMLLASIASWYLILTKAFANVRARRRSEKFLEFFWNAPSLNEVAVHLEDEHPQEPFSHLAYYGIAASRHHERHGVNRLNEAGSASDFVTRTLRKTIDEETSKMESGLTILASVGATAPFVGLLGTVWGIFHALVAIGVSGAGTLDKVAGPVGEALIMTAIGLAVAIPAVLGYNFLVRANRVTLAQLDAYAHDLFTFLGTGAKIDSQAQAHVTPLKAATPRPDMAFGSFGSRNSSAPMAEINVIPLVDIMLVLLVIFIITVPLLTNAVKIDLPKASSAANITKADKIQLSIDADGQLYWNGERLDRAQLLDHLQAAGQQQPTPELHLHADRNTRYEVIADVMSEAGKRGVARIGFITDPSPVH